MADYNIKAEITADTSGYESGVKKAQSSTKKLSTSISNITKGFGKGGLTGAISGAGLALGAVGLAIGVAVKGFQKLSKTVGECTEAYKKQNLSEIALNTAIQNNANVTSEASSNLKAFASEMQRTTNLGDEEIIPMMTQLIASGRTEAETMKIIATASDMSASGAMSFETAITQLNATLNGNIGRLGQQNAELKALTDEELKNGKAVDVLAEKYKGLATATVDTKKQLQNAIGDLKESFGAVFEKALSPMRSFFAEIIQGWADARKAKQEYEKSEEAVSTGKGTITDLQNVINQRYEALEELKTELADMVEGGEDYAELLKTDIERTKERIKQAERELGILNAQLSVKQRQEELANAQAQADKERAEKEKEVLELKEAYLKKIAEQERKWQNIKDVTGEEVKNEEKVKFYQDSLVDLMTQANGQITTNNQLYKDQMAIIEELSKGLEKQEKELADISKWNDKLLQQEKERLQNVNIGAEEYNARKKNATEIFLLSLQQLQNQEEADLKSVEGTKNAEEAKKKIAEYYANERLALQRDWNEQLADISNEENEAEIKAKKEALDKMAGLAKNYTKQMASIFSKMAKTIGNVFKEIAGFMKSAFSQIKGTMGKLFKFDTNDALDSLLKFEDSILTFFVETLPKMPQFLASAFQSIEVLIDTLEKNIDFDFIFNQFAGVFGDIAKRIPKLMGNISSILNRLLKSLSSMLQGNMKGIVSSISNILNSFLQTLPQVTNNIFSIFNTMLTGLQQMDWASIFANLGYAIQAFFDNLPATLTNLIGTLAEIIKGIVDSNLIPTIFDGFGETVCQFLGSADQITNLLESLITLFGQLAKSLLSNAGKIFGALIEALPDILMVILKSLPELLADIIGGAFEGVISVLKGVVNLVIKGINFLIDGLNGADFLDLFSDIPHIPLLAKGTDNAQKGLAIVGEAGPELVNFNGGEQVLSNRKTNQLLAGAGNSNTFNVNFYETRDTTAYAMVSQLKQYNRQMSINGVI